MAEPGGTVAGEGMTDLFARLQPLLDDLPAKPATAGEGVEPIRLAIIGVPNSVRPARTAPAACVLVRWAARASRPCSGALDQRVVLSYIRIACQAASAGAPMRGSAACAGQEHAGELPAGQPAHADGPRGGPDQGRQHEQPGA